MLTFHDALIAQTLLHRSVFVLAFRSIVHGSPIHADAISTAGVQWYLHRDGINTATEARRRHVNTVGGRRPLRLRPRAQASEQGQERKGRRADSRERPDPTDVRTCCARRCNP